MRNRLKGVTLVELMIVMVVIAILASIAVPSYRRYLLRAQRTDATTALLRIQSAEEKYLVQNGKYTNIGGLVGLSSVSEQGFYALDATVTTTGYDASATAKTDRGQKDDKTCQKFTINETGKRGATDSGSTDRTAECWR